MSAYPYSIRYYTQNNAAKKMKSNILNEKKELNVSFI